MNTINLDTLTEDEACDAIFEIARKHGFVLQLLSPLDAAKSCPYIEPGWIVDDDEAVIPDNWWALVQQSWEWQEGLAGFMQEAADEGISGIWSEFPTREGPAPDYDPIPPTDEEIAELLR